MHTLLQTALYKDPKVTLNGTIKIDPTLTHYYGNSLGGVVGEVYMASTVDVERGKSDIRMCRPCPPAKGSSLSLFLPILYDAGRGKV